MSAEEWLDRLDYDFEVAGIVDPHPAAYLRAISILLTGEASKRFRANPRMRAIMANRVVATPQDKLEVVDWLKTEFPVDEDPIEDTDVIQEVHELAQKENETLSAYYIRTL